jgi:LAS superfamily LD-carboxypeptidase LdcB
VNSLRNYYARLKAKANFIIVRLTHTKRWTQAANAEGIDLSPTSQADTYRSLETQEYGFYQRHTDKPGKKLLKQTPRIYKGKLWYLKKGWHQWRSQAPATTTSVSPSTSPTPQANAWIGLHKNAVSFGFSWEFTSGAKPWHLRYVTGDNVPTRVKEWLANKPAEA